MRREMLLVAALSALLGATAVAAANPGEQSALPRWMSQAVLGVLCGAAVALLAIAPYVDVVPDRYEVPIATVVVTLTAALVAVAALRWKARHRLRADDLSGAPTHARPRDRSGHARRP